MPPPPRRALPGGRLALAILLLMAAFLIDRFIHPRVDAIAGPENPALREGLAGYVVKEGRDAETQKKAGLFALSLKDGRERPIRLRADLTYGFGMVGGPDARCRVVYGEGNQFSITLATKVCLKRARLDGGGDEEIFCRGGEPNKILGEHLALSRDGRRAALMSGLEDVRMPGVLLTRGTLEIWDLDARAGSTPGPHSLSNVRSNLAWFPDSRRLLYVDLIPKAQAPSWMLPEDLGDYKSWDRLPMVHILDADTGRTAPFHLGWNPVIGQDGRSVLIDGLSRHVLLVDADNARSTKVSWKGLARSEQIALLPGNLVLYRGPPTEGTKPRFAKHGSFGTGAPLASIKVARLGTQDFATVIPYIDWRHRVSYGACP